MTAIVFRLAGRHPGRRACYGRTVHRGINTVALIAGIALTAGFLLAAGDQLPQQQAPRCVRYHSCACRFPGQGNHWHGNQLCAINWSPAPRALPHGGGQR